MPEINQGRSWYVFVSYASEDAVIAQRIKTTLKARGIEVWLYEDKLSVGTENWLNSVRAAILDAACFVIILTPNTIRSEPVHQEITLAYAYRKCILPVWAAGSGDDPRVFIWESFRYIQAVDIRRNKYDEGMQELAAKTNEVAQNQQAEKFDKGLVDGLTADDEGDLFGDSSSDEGLRDPSDKEAVRHYLQLSITERLGEVYRDNPKHRLQIKIFTYAFLHKLSDPEIANHLHLSMEQVDSAKMAGLHFMQEDKIFVTLARKWKRLQ